MAESTFRMPTLDRQALPGPETIHRRGLSNGITLLARENFASPSVVVSGYLSIGSQLDEKPHAGTAHLAAQGLMRGTKRQSAQQIFESLESIGARLSFSTGVHSTSFMAKGLVEDLELLLNLLGEVLTTPAYPPAEIERLRAQLLTALAIRNQDTSAQAHLLFDDIVYLDHPYSIPSDGFIETVEAIPIETIKGFHREHYRPLGMVVAIVGGVEARLAFETVEKTLGGWSTRADANSVELPPVRSLAHEERRSKRLEGKQQSDLIVGAAGPRRADPAYLSAALGNHILGRFGLMGRIGESVRESAGLAYYAYSSVSGGIGPGPWQVIAGINPVNEERALALIKSELRRFCSEPVSREEIQESQANIIGRLPLQLESNEGVAGALTHLERYQLGLDYYQRYPQLIADIRRDEILDTARRFLDPDRLAIAIAGPEGEATGND